MSKEAKDIILMCWS